MNRHLTAGFVSAMLLVPAPPAISVASPSAVLSPHILNAQKMLAETDPRLLRALTDLHYARYFLAHQGDQASAEPNEVRAIRVTDLAAREVIAAVKTDNGTANKVPPDIVRGRSDRLNAALRYLEGAYQDLNIPEDENSSNAWRKRAASDTLEAINFTKQTIGADQPDATCRALRKAYDDVRVSREDLNEALSSFGTTRNDAYNDTLQLRDRTDATLRDLGASVQRQCPH